MNICCYCEFKDFDADVYPCSHCTKWEEFLVEDFLFDNKEEDLK